MNLQRIVSREEFYNTYFSILNPVLKLTNKEIDILSEFLKIKETIKGRDENSTNKLTFSSTSRQIVCDKLNISKYNLNNYIQGLKKKRMIIDLGNGEYKLNPYLEVSPEEGFEVTFNIKID